MFKKLIFIGVLFLVVANQFASDKGATGLANTQDQGLRIIMPCAGKHSSVVQKMPLYVTTSDDKEIAFMSLYDYKKMQAHQELEAVCAKHVLKIMIMDQLKAQGYRGEATSPRSAVTEMLARIKQLEDAAAPVPTSGGASAAAGE